ncbi:MAG: hypothetical protein ACI8QZ_002458 [Chlamydiales bacterium]
MSLRNWITLLAFGLCACASTPEPVVLAPVAHARLTEHGFREASAGVAARLDAAAAWAVFPNIEDTSADCAHRGSLFRPDAPPVAAVLRCTGAPTAPAGSTYHLLIILDDPADVESLREMALDLSDADHFSPHDTQEALRQSARRMVVTSKRESLLFATWPLRQTLELAKAD